MRQKIKNKIIWNIIKRSSKVFDVHINKVFISTFLPPNPVIIDCGAHDGSDSIELQKIKGAKVYSFEPLPQVFDRLKEQTKPYKNIEIFKVALADFNGMAKMYVSTGQSDGSSSLMPPKDHLIDHPQVFFKEFAYVECKTLDQWAQQNGITKIDMLWLDMQGYEMPMLKASKDVLSNVSVIHTEVSLKETYDSVNQYPELKEFLLKEGFYVEQEAIPLGYDMGNVLFIRR